MGPFFFEVPVPSNEEVDGTRNRPSPNVSISLHRPHKLGPLLPRLKTGRASVIFGHVPLLRPAQKETSLRAGIGAIVPHQGVVKTVPAFAEHLRC